MIRQGQARKATAALGVLWLLLAAGGATDDGTSTGTMDAATTAEVDRLMQEQVDAGNVPGVVLLIGRCLDGRRPDVLLYEKAFGRRETGNAAHAGAAMTTDTLFDLASLTKPTCTAAAALLLVQDGRLPLEDPVARYIPGFARREKGDVRIRHLLTHTSGLPAYTTAPATPGPNADALIEKLGGLSKTGITGKDCIYSCLNYILLGRIVENVAKESLDSFLRRRLWTPLHMSDTTYFPTPAQAARAAPTTPARRARVHDPLAGYTIDYNTKAHACGNAGAFSTAADMSRLIRLILRGGSLDGVRVFSPASIALLTKPRAPGANGTHGWWQSTVPGTHALCHSGYTGTFIWFDLDSKLYIIVLSNYVYPDDNPQRKRAFRVARDEAIRLLTRVDPRGHLR